MLLVEAGCGGFTPVALEVEDDQWTVRDPGRNETYAADDLVGRKVRIATANQGEVLGNVVSVGAEEVVLSVDVKQSGVGTTDVRAETVRLKDIRSIQVHETNAASSVGLVAIGLAGAYAVWGLLDSYTNSR